MFLKGFIQNLQTEFDLIGKQITRWMACINLEILRVGLDIIRINLSVIGLALVLGASVRVGRGVSKAMSVH